MVENNNAGPGSGDQGGTHEQDVDVGRQSHRDDADYQSDPASNQQSDPAFGASVQSVASVASVASGRQPTPVQQPDTRLNESQQAASLSAADVRGGMPERDGTPEQDGTAERQHHNDDANR